MDETFEVRVESGSLRTAGELLRSPHAWSDGGVHVHGGFTGAHLLHAAVAACVLNDVHREARAAGLSVDGVRVVAAGGFDPVTWASAGIGYRVQVRSTASDAEVGALVGRVADLAEIPKALAAGAVVTLLG